LDLAISNLDLTDATENMDRVRHIIENIRKKYAVSEFKTNLMKLKLNE